MQKVNKNEEKTRYKRDKRRRSEKSRKRKGMPNFQDLRMTKQTARLEITGP